MITVGVKVAKAQVVQQLGLVKLGRVGDGGGASIIDWEFEQPANIEPNFVKSECFTVKMVKKVV